MDTEIKTVVADCLKRRLRGRKACRDCSFLDDCNLFISEIKWVDDLCKALAKLF